MNRAKRHPLIAPVLVTSLGTLASRVLGLVRDMATAALLGLAGGGVMDAFVVAFRVPNLFRTLFGEGALTASYLPVFTTALEKDRQTAWRLTSVLLSWLTVGLAALVLAGEGIYTLIWLTAGDVPGVGLLVGLGATLLPYLLLVCVAAQLSATLNALGHFSIPSLVPTVLNLCWLAAVWFVAPWFAPSREAQAYVVAAAVLVAGVGQIAVQVPLLTRLGFRFHYDWHAAAEPMRRIGRTMLPMVAGLTVTQINTFNDSLLAWALAAAPDGPQTIAWLGHLVRYPMQQGAAASIYYGERMYQFPLGVLGIAMATAIFPLLSRHAARGRRDLLGGDLSIGLRLVLALGVPASAGIVLLAGPLSRLLFEHGQFTAADAVRASRMIAAYATGVWAYCALPVMVRGFHALGDSATPAKIAAAMVALNLALNLVLIWPLAEVGLAVATAFSAAVQLLLLMVIFSHRQSRLDWSGLGKTALRTLSATALMTAAGWWVLGWMPEGHGIMPRVDRVLGPLCVAGTVYGVAMWLLGGHELRMLFTRSVGPAVPDDS